MKRRLLKLGLALMCGAIINVAVAWGLIFRPHVTNQSFLLDDHATLRSSINAGSGQLDIGQIFMPRLVQFDSYSSHYVGEQEFAAMVPHWSEFCGKQPAAEWARVLEPGDMAMSFREQSSGWPMLGCRSSQVSRFTETGGFHEIVVQTKGIPLSEHWRTKARRALPILPIWPGFAINTIFYAAMLWLLFTAPGFVRRRIRAMRHQCPTCAYPIGANLRCTECGGPVTQ